MASILRMGARRFATAAGEGRAALQHELAEEHHAVGARPAFFLSRSGRKSALPNDHSNLLLRCEDVWPRLA